MEGVTLLIVFVEVTGVWLVEPDSAVVCIALNVTGTCDGTLELGSVENSVEGCSEDIEVAEDTEVKDLGEDVIETASVVVVSVVVENSLLLFLVVKAGGRIVGLVLLVDEAVVLLDVSVVWLSVGGIPVTVVGVPDEDSMEGVMLLIVLVEVTGVWLVEPDSAVVCIALNVTGTCDGTLELGSVENSVEGCSVDIEVAVDTEVKGLGEDVIETVSVVVVSVVVENSLLLFLVVKAGGRIEGLVLLVDEAVVLLDVSVVWLSVGGTPVTVVGVPDEDSMEGVMLLIVLVEVTGVSLIEPDSAVVCIALNVTGTCDGTLELGSFENSVEGCSVDIEVAVDTEVKGLGEDVIETVSVVVVSVVVENSLLLFRVVKAGGRIELVLLVDEAVVLLDVSVVWLSVGGTPVTVVGVSDEDSMEGVTLLIVLVEFTGVWLVEPDSAVVCIALNVTGTCDGTLELGSVANSVEGCSVDIEVAVDTEVKGLGEDVIETVSVVVVSVVVENSLLLFRVVKAGG